MGPALRESLDPLDVLQEAFVEAHRSFPTFEPRGKGAFSGWIYRIVDHRLHDLADRHSARKRKGSREQVRGTGVLGRAQLRLGRFLQGRA